MRVDDLTGAALDWAVAKAEGFEPFTDTVSWLIERDGEYVGLPQYSTDWAQGGPIIEREKIDLEWDITRALPERVAWFAQLDLDPREVIGETPLESAMRCYVVAKLGDEIDVPKELL